MATDRKEIMGTWIIGEVFLLNVYRGRSEWIMKGWVPYVLAYYEL